MMAIVYRIIFYLPDQTMPTKRFGSLLNIVSLLSFVYATDCFTATAPSLKIDFCRSNVFEPRHTGDGRLVPTTIVRMSDEETENSASNVLGTPLECCCADVRSTGVGTGFYRNGYCSTGDQDVGRHTVCVKVTDQFLEFSKAAGNDLSTPVPQYFFPGLKEGDIWCLCAQRWVQAYEQGFAPKLYLRATHEKTLTYVDFEVLRDFALDGDEADEALDDLNEQRAKLNKLL